MVFENVLAVVTWGAVVEVEMEEEVVVVVEVVVEGAVEGKSDVSL